MTRHVVEKIRVNYASGRYDMLELLLTYRDIIKGQDIPDILTYSIYPEVKKELIKRIIEVPVAQKMYAEYQQELRVLVDKAEAMELSGAKHYPYQEQAKVVKDMFIQKLSVLETINYDSIRGFYLEDLKEVS